MHSLLAAFINMNPSTEKLPEGKVVEGEMQMQSIHFVTPELGELSNSRLPEMRSPTLQ